MNERLLSMLPTIMGAIMFANLLFYAWGSHAPESLAVGILAGFVWLRLDQLS